MGSGERPASPPQKRPRAGDLLLPPSRATKIAHPIAAWRSPRFSRPPLARAPAEAFRTSAPPEFPGRAPPPSPWGKPSGFPFGIDHVSCARFPSTSGRKGSSPATRRMPPAWGGRYHPPRENSACTCPETSAVVPRDLHLLPELLPRACPVLFWRHGTGSPRSFNRGCPPWGKRKEPKSYP